MRSRKILCLANFLLFGSIASPIFSQKSAAPPPDTLKDSELKQVVVTAQFAPTDLRETVNSVRLLDRKTIEQRAAVNLEELLRNEPTLRISQDAILGSALSINGMQGQNVKILVDGVPVVGRLNGNVDAGQLPLAAVRQVEIIEGAQSLMYGSEASAGVINLVTRQSQLKKFEAEASSLFETNGFWNRQARAGLQLGKFFVQANAGVNEFEPQPDSSGRSQTWNPKFQKFARTSVRFMPSERLDLRLSGNIFSEKVTNLGEIRRPNFKPYAFDDFYFTDRADVSMHGQGNFSKIFWQATTSYNRFDRVKNAYRTNFEAAEQLPLDGMQDTAAATGFLARSTFASQYSGRVNWLAGFESFYETAKDRRINDSTRNESGFATNHDLGIFSSLKFRISEKLVVQGGARVTLNQRFGQALTPAAWLRWSPSDKWVLKASYANGFRSPGLKELFFEFIDINHHVVGNPDLTPERSNNFRLELSHPFLKKKDWTATATLLGFWNDVRNRIALTLIKDIEYTYLNVEKWQTRGTGLTVRVGKKDLFQYQTALVLTGFYNNFLSQDASLPTLLWSPDWSNDLNFYFFKSRLNLNFWHKMTGSTPYFFEEGGATVEGKIGAWHLLNASVGTHFWKEKIRLAVGAKNLLDVRQVRAGATNEVGHENAGISQPAHWGRSFFVQASINLGAK